MQVVVAKSERDTRWLGRSFLIRNNGASVLVAKAGMGGLSIRKHFRKYREDEARDDHGRWTATGFHGSEREFDRFELASAKTQTDSGFLGRGHYFSTDPNVASGKTFQYETKVNLAKPLLITKPDFQTDKRVIVTSALGLSSNATSEEIRNEAIKRGYDGIVLDYSPTGYNHKEIVAFNDSSVSIVNRTSNQLSPEQLYARIHGKKPLVFKGTAFDKMSTVERRELERLAVSTDQFTNRIRREFLAAIDKLSGSLDAQELANILKAGDAIGAINYVNQHLTAASFAPIAHIVTELTITAAKEATRAPAGVPTRIEFQFAQTNPATVARLQQNEFRLIRELSSVSRQSVAAAIRQGITDGRNPLDVARDVRQFIGLTARQTNAVMNYRRALENAHPNALERALRDRRFDPTVSRAISGAKGLTSDQIDNMVSRYQARYLKYRAETIARTEATRATNEGNRETWRQAVADGVIQHNQVTRSWIYTHDGKTRPAHVAIPSMNPNGVGLSDAFATPLGPLHYPGDPMGIAENTINCRCAVVTRYNLQATA